MESPTSLILTKLRPPAPRTRTVHRARLFERLVLEPTASLVLVCAPAGYGKTTLLAEWSACLRQSGVAVAWYALDESDNSPTLFGAYLIASLEQALGSGRGLDPVRQVLRAAADVDLRALLPIVINALDSLPREVVLVLDDYHLIRAPAIHHAVEFLLARRPENLHLAIGSRANPPLPLARLRAKNRLIELRAADLRFTEPETALFLRHAMQLDLPADLVNRLAGQVEGWAAGLQLAALSLAGHEQKDVHISTLTGGQKQFAEYLLEEVVNGLPEALQSFLLYSSILERMSAPLCDAVLSMEHSASLLERLETLNLFVVALEDEAAAGERWFRYHHLFQDFLQTWLSRTQPERAAALHRAAVGWFAAHGSLREAAYHAFRCGDWSFAADFVEQHCFTLIIQSEIATIYEWCSAFPEAVLRSRPRLCVFQALALAYRFQRRHRARVEMRLQQAGQALLGADDAAQALEVNELAGVVRAFLAMTPDPLVDAYPLQRLAQSRLEDFAAGDPERFPWLLVLGYAGLALNQPAAARRAFEESLPLALEGGLFFGFIEATFHLARLAYSQGRLQESLEICRSGQAEFAALPGRPGAALPALGCLDVAAGCVLLEQDRLEEAGMLLHQGLGRMGWGMNPYYLMTALLALFRLYAAQGEQEEAYACLEQLEALWPDIAWLTQGCRVQARLRDQPDNPQAVQSAREWLIAYQQLMGENLQPPLSQPGLGPIGAAEAFFQANLIWARLQILVGDPGCVQPALEGWLQQTTDSDLPGREIELWLVRAQLLSGQGQADAAFAALETALSIHRRCGHVRVFDQNAVLDRLLYQAQHKGIYPADLERILPAAATTAPVIGEARESTPAQALVEPLSERELEVLRLIASGASNHAIAGRFVISVGTVKSHVHHILGKLDSRSRTEAVARARALGLLD